MTMSIKCLFVLLSVGITSTVGLTITPLGCYALGTVTSLKTDPVSNGAVTQKITLEYCAAICADYKYMAIKNSENCYCDNALNPAVGSLKAGTCNVPCAGNNAQKCGGQNHKSVYEITNAPAHVANLTEVGCYEDVFATRDIDEAWINSNSMTPTLCAQMCCNLGYAVMGLQYYSQCFCDEANSYGRYGPKSGCTTNCRGDNSENCGGAHRNRVFTLECTRISLGNEPHFMMSSGDTNFCFNLHGKDEEIFNLISHSEEDITVRGETFETVVNGNLLSYFSKIGIYARHQEIVFDRNDFQINRQRFEYNGNIESPIQVDDITITLIQEDPYKFIVKVGDDIKLMVSRSSNQHTDGFMGVYLLSSNGFTNNVTGIIGELIDTSFKVVEHQEGMKIEFDDHHESVPVSPMSMFSPDSKEPINCYYYSGVLGNKKNYQEATLL